MFKKIFAVVLILITSLSLIACDELFLSELTLDDVIADLSDIYSECDAKDAVTKDLRLETSTSLINDVSITWDSNKTNAISIDGIVNRSINEDINVILTLLVTKGTDIKARIFNLVVKQTTKAEDESSRYNLLLEGIGLSTSLIKDILSGSNVIITVNAPVGQKIDKLFVNAFDVTSKLVVNKYEFVIRGDTKVSVTYKNDEESNYEVTFDTNNDSHINDITVINNTKLTLPVNPTKDSMLFKGWFLDSNLITLFNKYTPITSDLTLYAKWEIDTPEDVEPEETEVKNDIDKDCLYTDKYDFALYLTTYNRLPSNYINNSQASPHISEHYTPLNKLSVGGDNFGNREGLLPKKSGRRYYQADIDYMSASNRRVKRLVYSDDGLIF